jgi:hypothetical protein
MAPASVERRIAEVNRQIQQQERRYVAALGVLGPPDIVGEHSEQEIANAKAERYLAGMQIAQLKEQREELRWGAVRAELRRRACTSITHRHVPVVRARTVARPRERRAHRTSSRRSSSSGDSSGSTGDSDADPPGLGRPLTAARRWGA